MAWKWSVDQHWFAMEVKEENVNAGISLQNIRGLHSDNERTVKHFDRQSEERLQ